MLTVVHNVVSDLQQQEFAVISDIDNRCPNLRTPCWNLELNGISIFFLFPEDSILTNISQVSD